MALTLTLEDGTGLANANSFASVAESDLYHESVLYASAWTAATTANKEASLVMATRLLDRKTKWAGEKKSSTQALAWPRTDVFCDEFETPATLVPVPVKDATAELARLLLVEDLTAEVAQNELEGIGLGKGALEIKFNGKAKKQIPSIVDDLLSCYGDLSTGGGFNVVKTVR
jgi:hypothetical protein